MKNAVKYLGMAALILLGMSCGEDEPSKTEYKDGVIVVNQGVFTSGTGTLTYKSNSEGEPIQGIYSLSNEGSALGNIAQSMIEQNGKNYISINNGGIIVVTDNDDFTLLDTISDIFQSRYFVGFEDQLYVSTWGVTGSDGSIVQLNTGTDNVESTINTGGGPEGMEVANDKLYVAQSGGFSLDSTLIIIDTKDNSIVRTIAVGDKPESVVKDKDDNIYVLCNGYFDFFDPSANTPGKLVKIDDESVEWSWEIPNGSTRLTIDTDNEFLYFNMNGNVVRQDLNASELDVEIVNEGTGYALGFDNETNHLYVGDAKDFSSSGEVYKYSEEGVLIDSFSCGIIPGFFHFK